MDLDELTRVACLAAREGARTALEWQHPTAVRTVRQKAGPRDLVSEADLETERTIRSVLRQHRPQDAVLGEEHGRSNGTTEVSWLVDPIDGTTSYLYGRADWAVSIAALDPEGLLLSGVVMEPGYGRLTCATLGGGTAVDGHQVSLADDRDLREALVEINLGRPEQQGRAGRMVDALLPHVRDLRRGGSAASSLAHVASGRADAVWSPGLQPWDGAAGVLLVLEAGGIVGDLDGPTGGRWPASGDVLAAPATLWEPLRALLRTAYADGP